MWVYTPHLLCVSQVITKTPLTEQEGGGASGGATAVEEIKYSAAALKKRLEERNLLSQLLVNCSIVIIITF